MRHMKRSSSEPWIENDGETGFLEPAFKQNTNDDVVFNFCKIILSDTFFNISKTINNFSNLKKDLNIAQNI